jgi:hypothetical protein
MDRRRFVPSGEGLEGRALLSGLFGGKTATTTTTQTLETLPNTFIEKQMRIKNLPFFMRQPDPQRFLPPAAIKNLQEDLAAIVGRLHGPTTKVVEDFNLGLRHEFPHVSLSPADAKVLNRAFGSVLAAAGATTTEVANLKRDMNQITLATSKSPNPTTLAASDYSLVLQIGLSVGRPIKQPAVPTIAKKDGVMINGGRIALTRNPAPTFVGVYDVGPKGNKITSMQIINEAGDVLGVGPIAAATGDYSVKLSPALPNGTYKIQSRAIDNQGHMSLPSHTITLKVAHRYKTAGLPRGPLGLARAATRPS